MSYRFEDARIGLRSQSGVPHLLLSPVANLADAAHAIIERHENGYRIVRCGGTPPAWLNGIPLPVGAPRALKGGDVIRLGRFCISPQFSTEPAESDSSAAASPLPAVADQLMDVLSSLVETYNQAGEGRRAVLTDALTRAHRPVSAHEAVQYTISLLDNQGSERSGHAEGEAEGPQGRVAGTATVIDALAAALARVLRVPVRFRTEFIGHTLTHPSDAHFLYEGEGETIAHHLLDSSIPMDERNARLQYVEEAAASVVEHQVAMLDAYKGSIIQGIDELLGRLDPDVHREAVGDEHALLSSLPVVGRLLVLRRIRAAWNALPSTDWDVAEQRLFRPAFTKAYLERVTAPHTPEDEP